MSECGRRTGGGHDPERRIIRQLDVPFDQAVDVDATVRLDRRASDAVLADLLGITGPTATARLTGVPAAGGWAAADGHMGTAWITPFNEVVGTALHADLLDPDEPLTLVQRPGNYSLVTSLRLTQGDQSVDAFVPTPDGDGMAAIDVPDGFVTGPLTIEIAAVTERTTRDRRFGDTVVMPAAIAEVGNIGASSIPGRFDTNCRDDLVSVDDVAVPVRIAGSVADAFDGSALETTTCTGPVTLPAGVVSVAGQPEPRAAGCRSTASFSARARSRRGVSPDDGPIATVISSDRLSRTIEVEDCPDGCWLIVGEGHHPSWEATTAVGSLGPSQLVAGGFNGWWIPPQDGTRTVWVGWTAQRPVNAAIAVSLAAAFVAVTLALTDRPRWRPPPTEVSARWTKWQSDGLRRSVVAAVTWVVLAGLFVEPGWAWWGLAAGAAVVAIRRIRLAGLVAVAGNRVDRRRRRDDRAP